MKIKAIELIIEESRGKTLTFLYEIFQKHLYPVYYEPRLKDDFIYFLLTLVRDNQLKLVENGKFLEGNLEYKIEYVRKKWNKNYNSQHEDFSYDIYGNTIINTENDNWWDDKSGFQAVWIMEDGSLKWATKEDN
ncbi:hypothetical protein SAMN05660772_02834 [Pasteurella testudinis DSM 23072]|uniref:Uncharacterized protein n=1 Tax=Pasteurella testudinis DSM 23072 TaxID=1122938 RepID=A0A1W1V5G1_9PAST|nr:DUF596 domain-containing protein [Pasteurella testudinis]SMB88588.1 hypothetical protein SAMN05660772_02834 [Pasteurella testudinis DSM 23072]SUB50428.1 Uncharacterized protein conserved in bacteria [Pasteurella testudinis]